MGDHEGWPQPSGLLPNGLLASDSASVIRDLDMERWSKAEKRTAELIACIEPTPLSEQRRNAVAFYVQQLIMKCLPCKVFTFGSVPLKTYLPDGDIDLTAFCEDESLKETWASQVRDMLESEEKNENAEFRVKEVQYIQAEVKIIKCLVENIVVDISFEQLGGLCTLCFLEEVDHLINKNHLFKRSIILIKAWCYYESRILGAHHALISTYALETLVLYIFHVFNNSFDGPLEVLYRFLEFFSNFDWDNYCLSLCGPVPISSLPDVTADPPRKDGGELLLSKVFLDACSSVYGVCLEGQENQEQPFITKHINVIDPLRVSNNLGRSVNKGNFYRIRSAFAFGAKRLARLLECPKESIVFELNQFFTNTWERHGSGIRLDVPTRDLWQLRPTNQHLAFDHKKNAPNGKKQDVNVAIHEIEVEVRTSSRLLTSQSDNYPGDNNSQSNDYPLSTQTQGQILHRSRMSDQNHKGIASHTQTDRTKRNWKPDNTVSEVQVRYLFARTRSSPELTDTSRDISFQMRHNKPIENGKTQMASPKVDGSRRKNTVSEIVSSHCSGSSSDDPSSGVRHSCSHHMVDTAADSNRISGGHADEPGNGLIRKDHGPVTGTQQEEQDPVNLMTSYSVHNFGGQLPMPLNLASTHVSLPISQSVLASMGFGQKNIPTNVPLIDPYWATNLQFHQGLMPYPLGQYIPPGVGVSTNSEDLLGPGVKNFGSAEVLCGDAGCEYWQERDVPSVNSNFPSCIASSWSSLEAHKRFTKETQGSARDEYVENFHQQDNQADEAYPDVRISSARFCSASQSGSVRSKTSSESSWDGSSARVSKVARDKRGKKTDCSAATSSDTYGKGKNISEQATNEADDEDRDWKITSAMGTESGERSTSLQYASSLDVSRHNLPGSEGTHTSGSDTVMPITPMTLGPASRQRVMDNSGVVPYTFYPTGPPVPFLTMLPVYNFPAGSGPSDASSSKMVVEDGPENSESRQNFDSSEGHDAPDVLNICGSMTRAIGTESSEELKGDILDCDFATHWQNLQYARFCQNSRHLTPAISSSPGVVPPMYLQGRFPWDVPGRPLTANVNVISQLMGYGPRFVPIAPLQSIPNRPTTVYQQYVDEPVKYRSGTGTYLPNPKASYRERHSSGTRRNSYNYDRSDHADREGNWNVAKARAAARSHNRNQVEKSRVDRQLVNDNRSDRSWVRPEPLSSFQSQNGPVQFSTSQSSSGPMAYGMYPLTGMNASGIMSNGQTVPSVVMLYPYDHNSSYVSSGEQLDFGTLGPMDFVGMNDALHSADVTRVRGPFVDQRHHGNSTQQSSPDQPSSPHFQRSVAQRNYQLKDEDSPPLVFQNRGTNVGSTYNEKQPHQQIIAFASQA